MMHVIVLWMWFYNKNSFSYYFLRLNKLIFVNDECGSLMLLMIEKMTPLLIIINEIIRVCIYYYIWTPIYLYFLKLFLIFLLLLMILANISGQFYIIFLGAWLKFLTSLTWIIFIIMVSIFTIFLFLNIRRSCSLFFILLVCNNSIRIFHKFLT